MSVQTLKGCIPGLDKLIDRDISRGSLIIVIGAPGTLKSSFVLAMLSNYLRGKNESGLYVSLEQGWASHLENLKNIGLEKPDNLKIADFNDLRKKYRFMEEKLNIFRVLLETIDFYKRECDKPFTCFGLDSLNAVYSFGIDENTRNNIYHLFNVFRENGLTAFVITEAPGIGHIHEYSPELFLSDGIIEVGVIERQDEVTRYLQIKKLRNTAHSMKKHRLVIGEKGISVLGPVYG